ncbi:xanthine dehydrogenase small subunit [Pseudoroseicyclus tamaricis]|uniref:Xanthine dehydrogenase small subunit n=1 Tax=Pseudoroseicyclus tamaricis TaxID=2705421 RepID=A0A6B2K5T3_9RHOB|nr:xanthine dehydrogenase small subunit [Pseudoroseicyclus tamaricis]NDV02166.1 xanthine dehydrogenase small subunit [Pseudoroseicyclus tamaricis]
MEVRFSLNGEEVTADAAPDTTLLDWLRLERRLTGTKEGCNEGDCGACTVMVTDEGGARPLNACILFLPQLEGKAVRTVEGLAGPDGSLHPVQETMVEKHGSQCGFCTPGFVVSMAVGHLNGRTDHDDVLAGNLCRCTGYAPIIRAAKAAEGAAVPAWMQDAPLEPRPSDAAPESADALAALYAAHPEATLVAGATDVGLWVTKDLRDIAPIIFLNRCADLKGVDVSGGRIRVGAMETMETLLPLFAKHFPSYAAMLRRFASVQIRSAATIGGSLANASPIGDNAPPLIALGATLHLRAGDDRREIPLEEFFLDYGKQDRREAEFVEAVSFPAEAPAFRVWKISKRFDSDISAVLGAFNIEVTDGAVSSARVAFGGMAGIPKRASGFEQALLGQPLTEEAMTAALPALDADFSPLTDMRATAAYRSEAARGLALRYVAEMAGRKEEVRA